jgi:hypothetical protein
MSVRKIKGSWWVDFSYNGVRLRKRSPHNSKGAAENFEVLLRCSVSEHGSVEKALHVLEPAPTSLIFANFAEQWMRDYVSIRNKPSEQYLKRLVLNTYILPTFGPLALNAITTAHHA